MFNILRKAIRSFKKDQSGVTAIEYGLIAIIMAAFIIFAFYKNIVPAMEAKTTELTTTIQNVKFDEAATAATTQQHPDNSSDKNKQQIVQHS